MTFPDPSCQCWGGHSCSRHGCYDTSDGVHECFCGRYWKCNKCGLINGKNPCKANVSVLSCGKTTSTVESYNLGCNKTETTIEEYEITY